MAISIEQVDSLMSEAITALDAGNYSTAILKASSAQGRLAVIPDGDRNQEAGGSFQFDRNAIQKFIENCRRLERDAASSQGTGIITVDLKPVQENCSDDYS